MNAEWASASFFMDSETSQEAFAAKIAKSSNLDLVIFLQGNLGAGKTTFARGFLRGCGYQGLVKSPTYTLVEPYTLADGKMAYHFDLYRLSDPEELEFMGLRDYFSAESLCLIEWPQQGADRVPPADVLIELEHAGPARDLQISALSPHGEVILAGLK